MKEKNHNFFFELELKDDQSIKLAFWADARSRAAFEYFRDVISFDTTYNTNRYNLVCGSFVGVNHHGNALKGILTDQCASMKRAIEACMPTSNNNSPLVYLVHHEEDSKQIKWYGLVDNKLLSDLYEDRHIWVPIYLDHHFWAGMRSTQRNNCLGSREQAEKESDAADFHTVIPCTTKSSVEAQFQHVYTHQKFREVQAQFRGKANCITRLTNSALGYSVYEVGEQVSSSIFNKFVVTYDSVAAQVKCQCLLFESRGILCRHALSVLSFERVTEVSPRYILERWSKKVKRRHTHIKSSHDEPLLEPKSKRFDELVFRLQNICKFASESEELTAILHRAYDSVMVEME
ncbi:Protein FAR-RED ELONGATED HYPOCOTYL [Arachis hypogaea]|nr:Protein FAR-RED ELONGATED HYPOCOTYL [Arachis hypogaea]